LSFLRKIIRDVRIGTLIHEKKSLYSLFLPFYCDAGIRAYPAGFALFHRANDPGQRRYFGRSVFSGGSPYRHICAYAILLCSDLGKIVGSIRAAPAFSDGIIRLFIFDGSFWHGNKSYDALSCEDYWRGPFGSPPAHGQRLCG